MAQVISVLELVLPVILMICIGFVCRIKQIITTEELQGLKKVISSILLPVVLFKAFYMASYTVLSLVMLGIIFISCLLSLCIGYLANRSLHLPKVMPYLLSGFEVGMLGYALFGLLAGEENIFYMAIVDLGQVLFVYTVYLALLKHSVGETTSVKSMIVTMFKNPSFCGVVLGILIGITNIGSLITHSAVGNIFTQILNMISAPTAGMILIVVGYELSFQKELFSPVLKTILLRVVIMAFLLGMSSVIVFTLFPFNKLLSVAMILLFSLPAPFIIPLYASVEKDEKYISTTLSMHTLVTIIIFAFLSVYLSF